MSSETSSDLVRNFLVETEVMAIPNPHTSIHRILRHLMYWPVREIAVSKVINSRVME